MKRIISIFLILIMIMATLPAFADENNSDPRLRLRDGDDIIPYEDGQFFTRYTPWLKAYHLMSAEEVQSGAHGGEGCQQIRCIDISPADSNLSIFGSDTTGVWITTDGGDFWYNTHRNISPADISDVMCHPTDTNVLFCYPIGTTTGNNAPGIYRSADMGRSWELVYKDYIDSSRTDKLFAYDSSANLYAVTGHGVVKSADGGITWNILLQNEETNSSTNRAAARSIRVSPDGKTLLVCYGESGTTLDGLNISYDGGVTWSRLNDINGVTDYVAYAVDIDPSNSDRWFLSARKPNDTTDTRVAYIHTLFFTTDKGKTWTEFKSGFSWNTKKNTPAGIYDRVYSQKPIVRIRMTADNIYICYDTADKAFRSFLLSKLSQAATRTGLWTSLDFKKSGVLDMGPKYREKTNMYFSQGVDIEGDKMYVCAAGPHLYTFSTQKWERKSEGFSGNSMVDFNMDDEGNLILSAIDGNIVYSTNPYTKDSPAAFKRYASFGSTVATMTVRDKYNPDRVIAWYGNANTSKSTTGIIVSENKGASWSGYDSEESTFAQFKFSPPKNYDAQVMEYSKDTSKPYQIITSWATGDKENETDDEIWTQNDYFYLDVDGDKSQRILAWDIYHADGSTPTYNFMYSDNGGETWIALGKIGTSLNHEVTGAFDVQNPNIIWYKSQYDIGKIDISNLNKPVKASYSAKVGYSAFNNLVQNPKKPHHFILTIEDFHGNTPSVMESLDYGESWHIVPGYFGRRTVNNGGVRFSTTTDEVFFGGHSGIMVYEYEKFRYYQAVSLENESGESVLTTQRLSDGKVLAPGQRFEAPACYVFEGWEYGGNIYTEGEEVKLKCVLTYVNGNGTSRKEYPACGENVELKAPMITKPGYVFSGWQCGDELYTEGSTITVTEDTTVEAIWTKK